MLVELRLLNICSSKSGDSLDSCEQMRMQSSLRSKTPSGTEWPVQFSYTMRSAPHARNLSVVVPRPIPWYALFHAGGLGSWSVPKSPGPWFCGKPEDPDRNSNSCVSFSSLIPTMSRGRGECSKQGQPYQNPSCSCQGFGDQAGAKPR